MPFSTGLAKTPSTLLNAINTHLTANGWTKIRGETDMNCASPKAARYWRVMVTETESIGDDYRELKYIGFRTTLGGADQSTTPGNWYVSSVEVGSAGDLATSGGSAIRSGQIYDGAWWCQYDFGSPTTIREAAIECGVDNRSPSEFQIQWSNDNVTWTTMLEVTSNAWVDNETQIFQFDDTYIHGGHVSATEPRRTGRQENRFGGTNMAGSTLKDMSEDYWVWQGPGYDASRRVYIHARGHTRTSVSTHIIEFDFSTDYDPLFPAWNESSGSSLRSVSHLMDTNEVEYWIYSNSKRIVLITRSGAQDYASSYVGFHSAFAVPDDYPFPLYVGSTSLDVTTYTAGESNARLSSIQDPGLNAAYFRRWDGVIRSVENRPNNNASNLYLQKPAESWMWPMHFGNTDRADWPVGYGSDYADYVGPHMFDFIVATQQNHLPMFPATIMEDPYGNIGVLDGVFAIPGGGVLSPEQVITISGQDYRVFPNRTRREDTAWFAVRED